jgi:hypothetical protein
MNLKLKKKSLKSLTLDKALGSDVTAQVGGGGIFDQDIIISLTSMNDICIIIKTR